MSAHINGFVTNLTGGLTRLFCKRCKEETIHRGFRCVRTGCGSTHEAYPVRSIYTRGISVQPKSKRKGRFSINGGYPLILDGSRPPKVELNQYGPGWQRSERDRDIVSRHMSGQSVSLIATVHKLSAERIRYILKAAGVWKKLECSTLGTDLLEPEKIS